MTGPRKLDLPDSASGTHADGRRNAPSAERNVDAILDVLRRYAPTRGRALEIASGTGQHICRFAAAFRDIEWFPSEADPQRFESINAWRAHADCPNLNAPKHLNATEIPWPDDGAAYDLIVLINLLHLISKDEAKRLLHGVASALCPGGTFLLYGPFRRDGKLTSDGDAAFDAHLQAQDPAIGYKNDTWVRSCAAELGQDVLQVEQLPANNLAFIIRRPR